MTSYWLYKVPPSSRITAFAEYQFIIQLIYHLHVIHTAFMSPFSLFVSKLKILSIFNLSLYYNSSLALIILFTLFWAFSNSAVCFFRCRDQICA